MESALLHCSIIITFNKNYTTKCITYIKITMCGLTHVIRTACYLKLQELNLVYSSMQAPDRNILTDFMLKQEETMYVNKIFQVFKHRIYL
jgi:hypothetical protein